MLSKIRNASSVRKSSATRIAGFISGSDHAENRCQAVAPSTLAASQESSGTSARPASSSSAMNGVVFQTSARMMTAIACHGGSSGAVVAEQRARRGSRARRPGVLPAEGGDDGDDPVRDQDRGAHGARGEDRAVHHERERHAEHQLDRHRDDVMITVTQKAFHQYGRTAPPRSSSGRRTGLVREAQVVALERQLDRVADRVRGHGDHDDAAGAHSSQPSRRSARGRSVRSACAAARRRGRPAPAPISSSADGSAHGTSPFEFDRILDRVICSVAGSLGDRSAGRRRQRVGDRRSTRSGRRASSGARWRSSARRDLLPKGTPSGTPGSS